MFKLEYPLVYKDNFGVEKTICFSDGHNLWMTIRDIEFKGTSFNLLEPTCNEDITKRFTCDSSGCLSAVFEIEIPLEFVLDRDFIEGKLYLNFDYYRGNSIKYVFEYNNDKISTEKNFGFVEDVLIDIKQKLPSSTLLKCCMSCAYSCYYPVGNNDFGSLGCFRLNKDAIVKIENKQSLMVLWDKLYRKACISFVQETFVCNQFSLPLSNQWAYKSF